MVVFLAGKQNTRMFKISAEIFTSVHYGPAKGWPSQEALCIGI